MLGEFRKDLPYYVLSKGMNVLSWLFIVWFLTRSLTPAEYGEYTLLYSILTLLAIITTSWLNSSIYRYLPEHSETEEVARFQAIIYRLSRPTILIALLLFVLVLLVSAIGGVVPSVPLLLAAVSLAFICHSSFMLVIAYFSAKRLLRFYSFAVIGQIVLYAAGLWLLIGPFGNKTTMIFVALALSYLPTLVIALATVSTERIDVAKYAREYMHYGLPLMLMSSATLINMYGDQFLIRIFASSTEVGLYSANYVFAERSVLSISSVMMMAYLPILFRTWESGEKEQAYRFIWKISYILLAVLTPIVLLLVFWGGEIAGLIIDKRFSAGNVVIPIVGLATVVTSLAGVFADVMTMQKRTKILAVCYILAALTNILLNVVFIPLCGFAAAAYTTLASGILLLAIIFYVAQKYGRILDYAF